MSHGKGKEMEETLYNQARKPKARKEEEEAKPQKPITLNCKISRDANGKIA